MDEERDENGQRLADAVARVRGFVVQELRAGQRADALSFALTFIATDLGLQLTHARNPLGVVRTVLQGVIAAASNSEGNEQGECAAGAESMPAHDAETVPAGAVIH
jgi:hypothetical protein